MFSEEETKRQRYQQRPTRAYLARPDVSVDALIPMGDRNRERRDMETVNPALLMFAGADDAIHAELDSEEVRGMHARLIGNFLQELDIQASDRAEMAKDEDFYDSVQWDEADARILRERGQEPMVINVISQSINWLMGSQKRARTDFRVLPRSKANLADAQRKTQILKYLGDANNSMFSESDAFAEATKAGLSWLECGVRDDTDGEPIYDRYESWRNIVMDSASRERDASDARYIFRVKWIDVDHALQMFPERGKQIELAVDHWDAGAYGESTFGDEAMDAVEDHRDAVAGRPDPASPDITRRRVRLIEAWFKVPEQTDIMSGGTFAGEIFDPYSRGHVMEVASGKATVRRRMLFRTYVMVMTTGGALWFGPSPYRHNGYPFTPLWAYRKASTGAPYGYIRNMRDPQRDINKRFSKALHILASNKVVMDEGAVADLDEFAEENARSDAIIVKKPGKALELNVERGLEASHLNIMQMSLQMIQTTSGVTDEAMGRTTNAVSGKAITARQDQAVLSSGMIFDNLRAAKKFHGEKKLSLVEQFMSDEKELRITDSRGNTDFIRVNDGLPENDIARTKADFAISEDAWTASIRQAQVTELFQVLTQLAPAAPQLVMVLLDVIVEAMDIPSRDLVVKRIRSITGMEDPDADPDVPDPEREQREQQKAMQAQMEARAAAANLAKLEGEAEKAQAGAAKERASAEKLAAEVGALISRMPGENMEQKRRALELAVQMMTSPPGAVQTADALLRQVGMGDAPAPGPAAPQPAPPAPMSPTQPQTTFQ